MKIKGRTITLDGNELARAISAYLVAQGVDIDGPRTTRIAVADGLGSSARVYIDPIGRAIRDGEIVIDRGEAVAAP